MNKYKNKINLFIITFINVWNVFTCSIYNINGSIGYPTYERIERMFALNDGPIFGKKGESYLKFNLTLEKNIFKNKINYDNTSMSFIIFTYVTESWQEIKDVRDYIIGGSPCFNTRMMIKNNNFKLVKDIIRNQYKIVNESFVLMDIVTNTTKSIQKIDNNTKNINVEFIYNINSSGWVNTIIFGCYETDQLEENLGFMGKLIIKNPYGYLPAILYGLYVFSGFLALGYTILGCFFIILLIKNRKHVIRLQYGILFVSLIGTLASGTQFFSFLKMNDNGHPIYPFSGPYLFSIILDAGMRTVARILLLCVCMGYGIVRAHLFCREILLIIILSLFYFISSVAEEVKRPSSSSNNAILEIPEEFLRQDPTYWGFIEFICNFFFILWIYINLEKVTKNLHENKQTEKLNMYKKLSYHLAGFVLFFTLLTFFAVGSRFDLFKWPIEREWIQLVAWPVLNFIVALSISYIWKPNKKSSRYALSEQIPSTDIGSENTVKETGIEMTGMDEEKNKEIINEMIKNDGRTTPRASLPQSNINDTETSGVFV